MSQTRRRRAAERALIAQALTVPIITPEPLSTLLYRLESHCVYYCCGFDSYDLSEAHFRDSVPNDDASLPSLLLEQLQSLRAEVQAHSFSRIRLGRANGGHTISQVSEPEFWMILDATERNLQRHFRKQAQAN